MSPSARKDVSGDALHTYLAGLCALGTLSREEEVELAEEYDHSRTALHAAEAEGDPHETAQAERRLMRARDRLAEANLRLVAVLARRYAGYGVPLSDLVQEGNIGLLRAIDGFDRHRGYRLSTYAAWWIRQAIHEALSSQGRSVRVPRHVRETRSAIAKFSKDFVQGTGREPTPHEIARSLQVPVARVKEALAAYWDALSFEAPIAGTDSLALADTLADDEALTPAALLLDRDLARRADAVLATLAPAEQSVIRLRFGIGAGASGERSVEEVAQELAMSPERVRQVEARALRKLQNARRNRDLRAFVK